MSKKAASPPFPSINAVGGEHDGVPQAGSAAPAHRTDDVGEDARAALGLRPLPDPHADRARPGGLPDLVIAGGHGAGGG